MLANLRAGEGTECMWHVQQTEDKSLPAPDPCRAVVAVLTERHRREALEEMDSAPDCTVYVTLNRRCRNTSSEERRLLVFYLDFKRMLGRTGTLH